jgi:paired amphipathic helix protein Sin3a
MDEGQPERALQDAPQHQGPVTFDSALAFLDQVKRVYSHEPEVYRQFLEIMTAFKTQEVNTDGVILRVKELFKGSVKKKFVVF